MCGILALLFRKWFNTYESAEKNIYAEKIDVFSIPHTCSSSRLCGIDPRERQVFHDNDKQ